MTIKDRRRALMGQKKGPVFHWDKSLGTSGLILSGSATAPSIDGTGLNIPYGPSYKSNSVELSQTSFNSMSFEIECRGFDHSTYAGDIAFFADFNGTYSRLLYNNNSGQWTIYNGSTSITSVVSTIGADFTIRCQFAAGIASWYIDGTLVGSQAAGTNPPNSRIFIAEASPAKTIHLTRIDVWRD